MLWLHLYGNAELTLTLSTAHAGGVHTSLAELSSVRLLVRFVTKQQSLQPKVSEEVNRKLRLPTRNTLVQGYRQTDDIMMAIADRIERSA